MDSFNFNVIERGFIITRNCNKKNGNKSPRRRLTKSLWRFDGYSDFASIEDFDELAFSLQTVSYLVFLKC